jgi:hypothetical protein
VFIPVTAEPTSARLLDSLNCFGGDSCHKLLEQLTMLSLHAENIVEIEKAMTRNQQIGAWLSLSLLLVLALYRWFNLP